MWGAATTYVGLTRHREHAQLYVPRELARNEAAVAHVKRAEIQEFVTDYKALDALARDGGATSRAELLQVAHVAWTRGFRPGSGHVDPTCLRYQLLDGDMEDHVADDRLRGDDTGEIDIQPLAFEPDSVRYRPWMDMAWRLRQLEGFVLDAILERIHKLRGTLAQSETLSGVLGLAAYLVKISRALRHERRDAAWTRRWRAIRAEEPAPRLVWRPFRLWHTDPDGEVIPMTPPPGAARPAAPSVAIQTPSPARRQPIAPAEALRPQRWLPRKDRRPDASLSSSPDATSGAAREDAR